MNLTWRRRVGGALWGVGLMVAFVWGGLRGGSVQARGIGWAPPVHVSAMEPGKLAALDVELHDPVTAGQVVARLDPAPLLEEREVLSAQLLAAQEEQSMAALSEARRFAQGLEDTMLDRATVATRLIEDEALLTALGEQLSIEQDLLQQGATSTQAVLDLQRQMRVVEARLSAGREALRVVSSAANAASDRSQAAPGANQWQVVAVARTLEALDGRLARYELSTTIEGQVTAVYHSAGEVIQAGDPVLQVRQVSTDEVVAWVPASASAQIETGGQARVVRANGEVLSADLLSVGTGLQPLPTSLLYDPQRTEFGVPVRLRLVDGAVAPDEPITLQL